ncbi:MAG TPA: phage baseplate assembly protein V [Candidatus Angelobacter sp.]
MTNFAKLSGLLLAACLLLPAILFVFVSAARPAKARAFASAASAAQVVRGPTPLGTKPQSGQAYGIYPAIVTSRPDVHMRVQVEIPSLNISNEWASPCVPVGSTAAPPLQSRVWVMFEGGNTHFPVWMGVAGS